MPESPYPVPWVPVRIPVAGETLAGRKGRCKWDETGGFKSPAIVPEKAEMCLTLIGRKGGIEEGHAPGGGPA